MYQTARGLPSRAVAAALAKLEVATAPADDGAAPEDAPSENAGGAMDVTYLTSGGPPPVGAAVADLERLRGSAATTTDLEPRLFPHLFPTAVGECPDGMPFATYVRRRLLDYKGAFQRDSDYTFYAFESWFRKKLSGAAQ
eukprot:1088070-Alexandrium_andersonii.AAC.1